MLRVGKQPLVGRSTGSPTLKEAARETMGDVDDDENLKYYA
jgi:hypothetical protein